MSSELYNPNVPPKPETSFADSQPLLLTNFLQLYNNFKVNHIPLDAGSTAGNHTIVELVEQVAPLQTPVSTINIYTKDVVGQTDQIFFRYQGNGQEFQYSNYQIYPVIAQNGQIPFFTFLPGGLLLYFGSFSTLTNNKLKLFPPIAKNIIGMSFCPIGTSPTTKPKVTLNPPENSYFMTINVFSALPLVNNPSPPCFYAILANT